MTGEAARRGTICLFAKPPVPGRVKTRLAAALGPEAAARLARAFLDDSIDSLRRLTWARCLLATTGPVEADLAVVEQGEGDLGARMERVLRQALEEAPFAIAIGADVPALPVRLLESARAALDRADAVLGPAEDGGFYLLGLRRCPAGLLADLPWSTGDTCVRTEQRLREQGLRAERIERWFDVDVVDDLVRLRAELARGSIVAPRTQRVLSGLQ